MPANSGDMPRPGSFREQPAAGSIAAVVVTYNRKELLRRCLDALLAQTRTIDRIFVVDNASTDGTPEALQDWGFLNRPEIEHLRLPLNSGGAGGFQTGMRKCVAARFDWLWLMDDDGFTEPACLEKLLAHRDTHDVLGPAVVDPQDPNLLNWIFRRSLPSGRLSSGGYARTRAELRSYANAGLFEGDAAFFNGVLLRRNVVESIGDIDTALFIRGDETDYFYRCRLAGLRIATAVDTLLFHPPDALGVDRLKYYYIFRNRVYLHRKYAHALYGPLTASIGLVYILLRYAFRTPTLSPRYLASVYSAVFEAMRGRLVPLPGGPGPVPNAECQSTANGSRTDA